MRLNRYEVSQALNTLNWQNIFDKYQHRDLTLSVESFIEKEVTPQLGFTVCVSTFTKRLCNIRKRANSNVSVIDLETTTHAVLSTSSRKTELTIKVGELGTIIIPSDNPELSAVKILHYLQNKELINA